MNEKEEYRKMIIDMVRKIDGINSLVYIFKLITDLIEDTNERIENDE